MPWILPDEAPAAPSTTIPPVQQAYAYQIAPWDSPLSLGVQAFIEFNGLVLNDRHQADRIRITSITGLDDADSTDSREVIPGDHGETAYDSWYRGRTFVMTGQIQAGSHGSLKRMERDLKAAFAPLVESPMKFRWFDVYDGFDDAETLYNYTPVIGSLTGLSVMNGILVVNTSSPFTLMRSADNRLWGDNRSTLRFIQGASGDASTVSLVLSFIDYNNYVSVTYVNGTSLEVISVVGGVPYTLSSLTLSSPLQHGQSAWLRGKREGDLITAELWTSQPQDTTLPPFITSAWLAGSDADAYGDQFLSQVGFGASIVSPTWALDDFQISSLCPGDISFPAKKMPNGMSIKDSQDSQTRFCRNIQITMRTSQPFGPGSTQSRSITLVPSEGNTPETGESFPESFPEDFTQFLPGAVQQQDSLLFINNRGTAFARPVIYVYGAIGNFPLINLTNGMQINWSGELVDGDYLVFDCYRRTLVNSLGTNMMDYFSSNSSRWMWLEPGWNDIYVGGTGYSGNTKVAFFWNHQWL